MNANQHHIRTLNGALDRAATGALFRKWHGPCKGQANPRQISNPVRERPSRLWIRVLAVVGSVALTLVMQGCATTRPVQSLTVYEDPKPASGSRGGIISIGTYNLGGLADPEGLKLTLGALNLDVWVFQEVISADPSGSVVPLKGCPPPERLAGILPGEPWHIYFVPVNPVGKGAWEGQAIASRYPLRNLDVWKLRSKGEMRGKKRRVALVCEVVTPKASILVINTDHEVAIPSINATDRRLQVGDLIRNIRQTACTNSVVLLGDFNTCGKPLQFCRRTSTKEIRDLRESLSAVSLKPLPNSEVPYKTFHKTFFSRALDHIFLRDAHCCRWGSTINGRGSDHQPLWTTIRTN